MIPESVLPVVDTSLHGDPTAPEVPEVVATDYVHVSLGPFIAAAANDMDVSPATLLAIALHYGVRNLDSAFSDELRQRLETIDVDEPEEEAEPAPAAEPEPNLV